MYKANCLLLNTDIVNWEIIFNILFTDIKVEINFVSKMKTLIKVTL